MKAKLAKMETAAERYRRIRAERAAKEEVFDFESPSGMIWKLRRPNLSQFILNGSLPMGLTGKLAAQAEGGADPESVFASMSWEEKAKSIDFANKIVRHCAVEPKIVETPTQPDEIGYDEVELDDYNAIVAWATMGGEEATRLGNFRSE